MFRPFAYYYQNYVIWGKTVCHVVCHIKDSLHWNMALSQLILTRCMWYVYRARVGEKTALYVSTVHMHRI